MRIDKPAIITCAVIVTAMLTLPAVSRAEGDIDVGAPEAIAANLQKQVGKRVTIKLASGQEVEGTVSKVGPSALHLSQLVGKEFFDAVVRLDQISAVIIRTKTK